VRGEGGDNGAGGKVGARMGKQGSEGKAALDRETYQYVTGKIKDLPCKMHFMIQHCIHWHKQLH